MIRFRGTMQTQRHISPRPLKDGNLEQTPRPRSRKPIGLKQCVPPSLAGKKEGLRKKPSGSLMKVEASRLKPLRPPVELPPAAEASRLKLQNQMAAHAAEDPTWFLGTGVPGRVPAQTLRTRPIGRTSTLAEWFDSSEPVELARTG